MLSGKPKYLSPEQVNDDAPPEHIQCGSWVYKLQHKALPTENLHPQEKELAADRHELPTEIDISMYALADKYGISSLRQHALDKLEQNMDYSSKNYGGIFRSGFMIDQDIYDLDEKLKKILAQYISKHYKMIRTEDNAEASAVRGWLLNDPDFTIMVLDQLPGVEDSKVKNSV